MTRAAEFCWICETPSGKFLRGINGIEPAWTNKPEKALRFTEAFKARIVAVAIQWPNVIGFRKILAG